MGSKLRCAKTWCRQATAALLLISATASPVPKNLPLLVLPSVTVRKRARPFSSTRLGLSASANRLLESWKLSSSGARIWRISAPFSVTRRSSAAS